MSTTNINAPHISLWLNKFADVMYQDIWNFNQFLTGFETYNLATWNGEERDNLAMALSQEFENANWWLGYYPHPVWKEFRIPIDQTMNWAAQTYQVADSAYLNNFGQLNYEVLGNATVVYSGLDLATVSITVTPTTETDNPVGWFAIYPKDADGGSISDNYLIQHDTLERTVTDDFTLTGHKARFVKPSMQKPAYNNADPKDRNELDWNDSNNYVEEVQLVRFYIDEELPKALLVSPDGTETEVVPRLIDGTEATFCVDVESTGSSLGTYLTHQHYVKVFAQVGLPFVDGKPDDRVAQIICRRARVNSGINARDAEAKISPMYVYDERPAADVERGVGYVPNPLGGRNIDVESFRVYLTMKNWRGQIDRTDLWNR